MRGKILFLVGLGVGYVFGTKAGRQRYNQMKDAALKVWNDPRVQEQVSVATEFVKDRAPEVADFVTESVKKVAARTEQARGTRPASKPAAKPATQKSTGTTRRTTTTGAAKK